MHFYTQATCQPLACQPLACQPPVSYLPGTRQPLAIARHAFLHIGLLRALRQPPAQHVTTSASGASEGAVLLCTLLPAAPPLHGTCLVASWHVFGWCCLLFVT